MHSTLFFAAGLASLASAFTQPGTQTWGALLTPDTSDSVTQGKDFTITWDPASHPTDGVTVSLVLCHGPGSNCVLSDTAIAEGVPADQKSYDWKVPCTLTPGVQSTSTGYGMLIIVDGTGEFQYSTQFSVLENDACASSSGSGTVTSSATASTSSVTSLISTITKSTSSGIVIPPPAYATGSSASASWGNFTATAFPTGTLSGYLPGTTWIVSTSGSVVYTVTGETTPTATVGASTLTTVVGGTSAGFSATATSSNASAFTGGAANIGSSFAGIVVAGAVAVFAL